ncbi:hypothetical protein COCOBI_18-1290 [Coccomyxa sp. Obi]|nr:hypothetical protein COCOBI_18-1290 [Coccomyxa sp. Obi]
MDGTAKLFLALVLSLFCAHALAHDDVQLPMTGGDGANGMKLRGLKQINPAVWVNDALGGTGNGVFSSSWNANGDGGGAIGTFGPGGSNQMTLIDSATGEKFILVNGCLATTVDPPSSSAGRKLQQFFFPNEAVAEADALAIGTGNPFFFPGEGVAAASAGAAAAGRRKMQEFNFPGESSTALTAAKAAERGETGGRKMLQWGGGFFGGRSAATALSAAAAENGGFFGGGSAAAAAAAAAASGGGFGGDAAAAAAAAAAAGGGGFFGGESAAAAAAAAAAGG